MQAQKAPVESPPRSDTTITEGGSKYKTSSEDDGSKASDTLLSDDPFSNESSRILFEGIDRLRRCGAGQDLDLPQLVIVGKQSAGKSSLLQSLTDIPFPVGIRLCTQFAMRIISRRTAPGTNETFHASIEDGDVNPFSGHDDDIHTEGFSRFIPNMNAEAFEALIIEAKEAMGIGSPLASEDNNYSSKVLKIELSGPNRSHFGILDLPGVFSSRRGRVSRREMDGVVEMVTSYMRKPENIIICVADASGDIQNEQILELASDVDSSRLVGVLTKCDNSENPEDIVQYVNERDGIPGKSVRWHVVQNRGPKASDSFDREHEEMSTFNKDPWLKIPESQRGIPCLRKYLANLLCKRIRDAFPGMLNTVTNLLEAEKRNRKEMGESRGDHAQRLAYLVAISQRYQDLAHKSLSTPDALPDPEMKLRGKTRNAAQDFAENMINKGHLFEFLEIGKSIDIPIKEPDSSSEIDNDRLSTPSRPRRHRPQTPTQIHDFPTPKSPPTKTGKSLTKAKVHPLYEEIRTQILENRGEELPGVLNPAVIHPIWRKQTSKWKSLGEAHLNSLVDTTTYVSLKLFEQACYETGASERTQCGLEARILGFSTQARGEVMRKLDILCDRNENMALQTSNPAFLEKVHYARSQRFRQALDRYTRAHPPTSIISTPVPASLESCAIIDIPRVDALFNELHPHGSRSQNVEDEIHDLLRAYYEVRVQDFVYDVSNNIDEPFLVGGEGPLLGLSTGFVMGLTEGEIEVLGGDEEADVVRRRECEGRIRRLQEAVWIAGVSLGRTGGVAV
ncbi:P-loop containing nucleoside triphosphate hydrolase protein [Amylocarpus encephaloides]|uniref:P-loop containing nucleoside triphosphate hydrolase protein n=1 Tax=Amylocarpus encephaloides TaxID=45428 RepID=A0A9P7YRC4_9HELO|nr:P-loop containing nucleoside triphosphate hydrolase protein [Amylocarpus encephaloides]